MVETEITSGRARNVKKFEYTSHNSCNREAVHVGMLIEKRQKDDTNISVLHLKRNRTR